MDPLQPDDSSAHNLRQRSYFERITKKTMVPRDTPYLRRHIDEAMRFAGATPEEHILEVGCGMGRYTLLMAQLGWRVSGMDLSPVLLERLQAFNAGGDLIDLYCADLEAPPAELTDGFDVVAGFFVLHHVHDLARAMRGVVRLLKPGGRAVFVEPNPLNPLYFAQIAFTPGMSWRAESGMTRMRPRQVRRTMEAAGLVGFRSACFGVFPPFLANRSWARGVEGAVESVGLWRHFLPFQLFLASLPERRAA